MHVDRIVPGLVMVGLLTTVVGCSGAADQPSSTSTATATAEPEPATSADRETPASSTEEDQATPTPTSETPSEPGQPVTATDREALLSGAGPVDADAPDTFTETDSGLKYRILRKSDGRKATASDSVTVHYRGWLDDGTEFDSSYERGEPFSTPLSGVIPGWTEGMQLIGTGGMVELWIPTKLGYGASGAGDAVPPNATLHFIVELIDVK